MLVQLNETHQSEILREERSYIAHLRKLASENNPDVVLPEDSIFSPAALTQRADRLDELIKDKSNWFIDHGNGIYEYDNPVGGSKAYPWEGTNSTFFHEMQEVYKTYDDNFTDEQHEEYMDRLYDDRPSDYGVCDNGQQILDEWPSLIADERKFIIVLRKVTREGSPDWRWHKNGRYIGTQNSQHEHLGNEEDIEFVYQFKIIRFLDEM